MKIKTKKRRCQTVLAEAGINANAPLVRSSTALELSEHHNLESNGPNQEQHDEANVDNVGTFDITGRISAEATPGPQVKKRQHDATPGEAELPE